MQLDQPVGVVRGERVAAQVGAAFAADYPDRLIELHKVLDATPIPVIGVASSTLCNSISRSG
ncbi:hypothetical protein JHV675_51090 [Mycobacterium avium subsp. hominissuis]